MAGNIQPISTESLLTSRLFTVERRRYSKSDGHEFIRDAIVHPGAVVVLPVLSDGSMVMIRNTRFVVGLELWELPAGTLEPGEDPGECAGRELKEETGYQAETVEPMGHFFTSPGILTEQMWAFRASGLKHVGQDLDDSEDIQVEIVRPEEAKRMLVQGRFLDAKTMAVLGRHFLSTDR